MKITESDLRQLVCESVKQVLKEISYDMDRRAYQASAEGGDYVNKPKRAESLYSHLKDRASQNFNPNLDVIIVGSKHAGKYKAGNIEQNENFTVIGYKEPSRNSRYNDSILIGAPIIKGYIGPMDDGGKLRYETPEVYNMMSM